MNPENHSRAGLPPRLKEFLQRWAITTLAVIVAEWVVPGISCRAWPALLVATFLLGAFNVVLRPLLVTATVALLAVLNVMLGVRMAIVTLPFQIGFFGFLLLAINAALLLTVGHLVPSFSVAGFKAAFWGGVVISLITLFLNSLTGSGHARITVRRGGPRRPNPGSRGAPPGNDDGGGGPIIDV